MRWDIFCKVIDNHGDLGVCWRLAVALGAEGDAVRLWVDDPAALRWMAPDGAPGVTVLHWRAASDAPAGAVNDIETAEDAGASARPDAQPAPDVLVEAFGCDPAPDAIARFASRAAESDRSHRWINLEYLSAEPSVERLHGLPSPVFRGPGEGLTKHFFYPGFTPATGGLLREPDLMAHRERFDRASWLARQGIDWRGERLVCLFCYEPAALADLLAGLESAPEPTRLLVTAGRAARALPPGPPQRGALSIDWLPYLPQTEFDHLLWACDLNFVRGEDSLVRALWAGAPFVWQIYPQDDDAHHHKLGAFLDWMEAPASLRRAHRAWNGIGADRWPTLDRSTLGEWQQASCAARGRLAAQDDLVTRLRRFIAQKS